MGRTLGSKHAKKRVYLTPESKREMADVYNKALASGVMFMYQDSTPDTRLERKFLRLKNHPKSLLKHIQ